MAGVCRGGICLDKWLYDALTVCTSNQSIAEAKNRLSELLAAVRRGARYRIYDRDTQVADLVPVDDWQTDESRPDGAAQRRRLVQMGVIRAGEGGGPPREILRAVRPSPRAST